MVKRPTILVLDDDTELLEVLRDCLSEIYDVFTARDTLEAATLLNMRPYALFITDLSLPVMMGVDLLRMIRAQTRFNQMPILVISAFPDLVGRLGGIRVEDFLPKPFSLPELTARIDKILATTSGRSRSKD